MPLTTSKKAREAPRKHAKLFLAISVSCILVLLFRSPSFALGIGSTLPEFTLDNLQGDSITPSSSSKGELLVLYFFDTSEASIDTLAHLHETAQKSAGILSLLAVSRENPAQLSNALSDKSIPEAVALTDTKGITSAYGLSRKLPAVIIVGADGIICAQIAPIDDFAQIITTASDAFISMGFPMPAKKILESLSEQWQNEPVLALCAAYASILTGSKDDANRILESFTGRSAAATAEIQTARSLLLFRLGMDDEALAACSRAPKNGFANYVAGMLAARSGRCGPASTSFKKAVDGRFMFDWQRALALNMAARAAEAEKDDRKALRFYKDAFALAPLNATINANLLSYYWRTQNFPAATAYTSIIRSVADSDSLPALFVNEFESEMRFKKDSVAARKLKKQLEGAPVRKAASGSGSRRMPQTFVVPDFTIEECTPESNFLPVALASLLRQSMEGAGNFTAIQRPELLAAAEHMNIPEEELENPLRIADISRALSGDLLAFGEVGNYKGTYYLNVRIAEVASGEIIAVASERLDSPDELTPAVKRTVGSLIKKISDYYAHR